MHCSILHLEAIWNDVELKQRVLNPVIGWMVGWRREPGQELTSIFDRLLETDQLRPSVRWTKWTMLNISKLFEESTNMTRHPFLLITIEPSLSYEQCFTWIVNTLV